MNLSPYAIEVVQPNQTVRRLITDVLRDVNAEVQASGDGELCDLLLFDVEANGADELQERLEAYRAQERPILLCGLRHLREQHTGEPWLDRPFSASALLFQCAALLELEPVQIPESSLFHPGHTMQTREEPIRSMMVEDGPPTREIDFDEASMLEREFGLEPGVLGGREAEDMLLEFEDDSDLVDASELIVDAIEVDPMEQDENLISGGRLTQPVRSEEVDVRSVADAPERGAGLRPPPSAETAVTSVESGDAGPPLAPPSSPIAVDEETSIELRGMARMLAQAWGRIGLSARVEDRSDHLSRILHKLFEAGLDGAAGEVQRIPQAEGFSGSLRVMPLVGLFRTIRDRKLRGRLELSTADQAYVLYVDRHLLMDIDALAGDSERMLLQILHQHGAIDGYVYQTLLQEYANPDHLAAPLEMRLRLEGLVSDAAIGQARVLRGEEIFKQACRARTGNFAFIEMVRGGGQSWPVHELRLNIDEMILALMRESSVQTEHSEATSRTRLMLDPARMASIDVGNLTLEERELLELFREARSLREARERSGAVEDIDAVVNRLKRAELLRRDMRRPDSGSFEQPLPPQTSPSLMTSLQEPTRMGAAPDAQPTVVTELDEAMRHVLQSEADEATVKQDFVHPPIEDDEEENATVSVGSSLVPSTDDLLTSAEDMERLIAEVSSSIEDSFASEDD